MQSRVIESNFREREPFSSSHIAIFAASLGAGFAIFSLDLSPFTLFAYLLGAVLTIILLLCPEFTLALYVVIGDIKGDERIAALLPVDLTLVLGAILLAGMILNLLRRKRVVPLPPVFFLYLALIALMGASLTYTPVVEAGMEKLARFLTVTGVVIVAPFLILGTPRAMSRFLTAFGIAAFAICAYSLTALGGSDRLATPSNNTIGLGHLASALIVLIWLAVVPRSPFPGRTIRYFLLAVPAVALIGSGSRGAATALGVVLIASVFLYRRLLLDLACLLTLGVFTIPFVNIPESSFEYLGTLARSRTFGALLYFRNDLLGFGWKLLQEHPLLGAGIQGYRFYSPNAGLYNWPHNIILEIACEVGIPAALITCCIFAAALWESVRQLKDKLSPYATFSQLAAALLLVGIINAMNTGDINSDRSTWLFVSLVFVIRILRTPTMERVVPLVKAARPVPA